MKRNSKYNSSINRLNESYKKKIFINLFCYLITLNGDESGGCLA